MHFIPEIDEEIKKVRCLLERGVNSEAEIVLDLTEVRWNESIA